MNVLFNLLVGLQIIAALVMIGLVLIQHGKGADMGASFGSGASGSLFGATGSANFLSRSTAVCAAVFFASTLALSLVNYNKSKATPESSGVLSAPSAAAPASAPLPTGAGQIPQSIGGSIPQPSVPAASAATNSAPPPSPAASTGAGAIPKK